MRLRQNSEGLEAAGVLIKLALLAFAGLFLVCAPIAPICAAPSDSEMKAAFLYNFANFVEWPQSVPADSNGTLVIGIYGDTSLDDIVSRTVAGKTINGKRTEIKRFKNIRDLKPCHILFIASSEESQFNRIFEEIRGWHVLTVGDCFGFLRSGGMINFVVENKKIRFEISAENAKKAGLKVSSKLLKLAKDVQ